MFFFEPEAGSLRQKGEAGRGGFSSLRQYPIKLRDGEEFGRPTHHDSRGSPIYSKLKLQNAYH